MMKLQINFSIKNEIYEMAYNAGFSSVKYFSNYNNSMFAFALPYGNDHYDEEPKNYSFGKIAPFARYNYYKESVERLKKIVSTIRKKYGGEKSDCRIFCNSQIDEKNIAALCGLGFRGKNDLVITENSGSLVVLSFLKIPFEIEIPELNVSAKLQFHKKCENCSACEQACPTGAIRKDGIINREKCIQWYASGNGKEVPDEIKSVWDKCFYGCNKCLDVCPFNNKLIKGIKANIGRVEPFIDIKNFLLLSDDEIKAKFHGTALGMKWLRPEILRRNANLCLL